ncbi:hypothetical protein ACK1D7_004479 [Salmonella enterica]
MTTQNNQLRNAVPVKPFTYIVRFDVAPLWTADGFILSDHTAQEMLSTRLDFACSESEIAACVLSAPETSRIENEQGYPVGKLHDEIVQDSPVAYSDHTIVKSITDAIELLDGVAFVRDDADNTADVLEKLRRSRDLLTGSAAISNIVWQEAEA